LVEEEKYLYLPDECWECIFSFIVDNRVIIHDNCLKSLSLVSKQFLSITNRLKLSLCVQEKTRPFLKRLLKRFTNLTSLDLRLKYFDLDLDYLLCQISNLPLKLTSLRLPYRHGGTFPINGLQVFSQNITTLTSLTCPYVLFDNNDLILFADCFPLLKELNLIHPLFKYRSNFINGIHYLLSKCQCLQHMDLEFDYHLKDQHVVELSSSMGNLVSLSLYSCLNLTESALFSLVRNCPSLSEIKMKRTNIGKESVGHSNSLVEFGVYPQLKSLYLDYNSSLSDEIIILFASIFPNLQLLYLTGCHQISEGICHVLWKCCKLKHLKLASCKKVKLHGMNFKVPKLEVLDLSNTSVDDETLYVISKYCCGLLQLFLYDCDNVTQEGVKHVLEKCTQLRKIYK